MSNENKDLIRRWIEESDKGNLDVFDELCAPDYVCHMPGNPEPLNRQQHKEFARSLLPSPTSMTVRGQGKIIDVSRIK